MKTLAKIIAVLIALAMIAFVIFRTPDTDAAEMRAKYGTEPSQFVDLGDGLTVHLRDEGPREAPVLILLHGSSADLHTWEPWTEAMKADFRIIRFDQIGHGLTGPAPDANYSKASFVSTVNKVADKLELERFVLAGSSMGGGVAMSYALEFPERLNGLVMVAGSGAPVKREESGGGNLGYTILETPGLRKIMTQITPRSLVEKSLRQSVSDQSIVTPEAIDRYWELLRYPGNRAATLDRFATPRETFTEAQMQALEVPTLLMWGTEDALVPFAASAWYAAHLPNAAEVSYDKIGHLPMEEVAQRSAADLQSWLGNAVLNTQSP